MKKLLIISYRTKSFWIVFSLILPFLYSPAQTGCPFVNAGQNVNLPCNVSCANLTANFLNVRNTTSYTVAAIPYSPQSYTTGTTILANVDDEWSNIINLPFRFCFFGNSYNRVVIGSNGIITFDLTVQIGIQGACGYSLSAYGQIPTASAQCNSIMGPYHDIDPTNQGSINYKTIGTAPCRMFVVSWNQIPYYGDPNSASQCCCQNQNFATQQIILYETTNVIDINIRRKNFCTGWENGLAIQGIQNISGTVAYAVAGRNNTQWSAQNDSRRFTPNGTSTVSLTWFQGTMLIGTGATVNVCPTTINTTYTIQAIYAACGNGTPVTVTDNIVVTRTGQPVASFSAADACYQSPTVFQNNSTISTGFIISNFWKFGDGTTDTLQNPAHLYANPGSYNVTLYVTGSNGCVDSLSQQVTVYELPAANFSSPSKCINSNVLFTDQTIFSSGTLTSWNWNFGDGTISSDQNPIHSYAAWGTYNVQLIATSANGCRDTMIKAVDAYPLPDASFSAANVCLNTLSVFQNTSVIDTGYIISSHWNFDDGSQQTTTGNALYTYSDPGFYNVTLVTTSDHGCVDSISHYTQVYHLPVPEFSAAPVEGCQSLTVAFADQSSNIDGSLTQWSWNFGNNQSSTNASPLYIYNDAGQYDVTLTVTSSFGCINSLQKQEFVWVHPLPKAGFDYTPKNGTIFNPEISFSDLSSGAFKWYYDFGDNSTTVIPSPQHVYKEWGSYPVAQVVTTNYGCTDTITITVVIDSAYICYLPNAFTPNEDGINDYFFCNGIGLKNYELNIYNRWGQIIFKGNNLPWNGKQGDRAIPGVYAYQFIITDIYNKIHIKTGAVSVIY